MDGCCSLTSHLTVFHSYQGDGNGEQCAMKRRSGSNIILPPAGLEPETP